MRHRAGFTILELLVVVTIISVLAALLLPTVEKAARKAQFSVCANTFRQLGVTMQCYAGDQNGYYPYRYSTWTTNYYPACLRGGAYTISSGFGAANGNDRPAFAPYVDLDTGFWCPLSPPLPSFDTATAPALQNWRLGRTMAQEIWLPFDIYAGEPVTPPNTKPKAPANAMMKVGMRHRNFQGMGTFTNRAVAADHDSGPSSSGGPIHSGHSDGASMAAYSWVAGNAYWYCFWRSTINNFRDPIDRNVLFDDGHVTGYGDVALFNDPRMVQVSFSTGDNHVLIPREQ